MHISMIDHFRRIMLLLMALGLIACGGGGSGNTTVVPPEPPPPPIQVIPTLPIDGFTTISEAEWTPIAVQKVLHTFALGGHASPTQIDLWAAMHPVTAIQEILTFDDHNNKLSPSVNEPDQLMLRPNTLTQLAEFWASDDPANGVPVERRPLFDYTNLGWTEHLWPLSATVRGLNPFRSYVLYHEVNQHMVANLSAAVPPLVLMRYYDELAAALEDGKSYDQVIALAASSPAIAIQYGHYNNRYVNDECRCNEDFAREYYQLFFGITGSADPLYHETTTIKNTAKALTDIRISQIDDGPFLPIVTYGTDQHFSGALEMLHEQNVGSNTKLRMEALSAVAIQHPESLKNLPVMLIAGMADDNLNEDGKQQLRIAWASMQQKDLLLFIRAYAISTLFHSEQRIKYLSSVQRRLLITNKLTTRNDELYQRIYAVTGHLQEGVMTLRPINNVFGGQSGDDAASSADVFRANYNESTVGSWKYLRETFSGDDGFEWRKDWRDIIPRDATDNYRIDAVADWLWRYLLADDGQLLGPLERAHLYALLAVRGDLSTFADESLPDRVYTVEDVSGGELAERLAQLGQQHLQLDSTDDAIRRRHAHFVGQAVSFITATPYMFYQRGKAIGDGT